MTYRPCNSRKSNFVTEPFYDHLLPDLAAQGKTVIAVTHDERYFHVAHRIIKMELGHIKSDVRPQASSLGVAAETVL